MAATHKGECFCGAVHVEVSGEPEAMGYCHCQSCRSWSAAPVNAFTLWKPDHQKTLSEMRRPKDEDERAGALCDLDDY